MIMMIMLALIAAGLHLVVEATSCGFPVGLHAGLRASIVFVDCHRRFRLHC